MKAGCRRKVTDTQIARLKKWKPGDQPCMKILAETMGFTAQHGWRLRNDRYKHKQPSPK